jgi:hypothetical protein
VARLVLGPDQPGPLRIPSLQLSRFMGHAKVTTTLSIYTHLFDDDHAETMAALEAMSVGDDAGFEPHPLTAQQVAALAEKVGER